MSATEKTLSIALKELEALKADKLKLEKELAVKSAMIAEQKTAVIMISEDKNSEKHLGLKCLITHIMSNEAFLNEFQYSFKEESSPTKNCSRAFVLRVKDSVNTFLYDAMIKAIREYRK